MNTELFFKINRDTFSCKKLKKQHLYVIHEASYFNTQLKKPLYKSQSTMAKEAGVSVSSIGRAIEELKKWDLINVKEQGFKQPLHIVIKMGNLVSFIDTNKAKESPTENDEVFLNDIELSFCQNEQPICQNDEALSQNDRQEEHLKEQLKERDLHVSRETHSSTDLKASFQDEEPKQEQKPKAANDRIQPGESYPLVHMCYGILRKFKMEEGLANIYLGKLSIVDVEASESKLEELISEGATEYHNTEKEAFTTGLFNLYQHGNFFNDNGEVSLTTLIDPYDKAMSANVMVSCDYMNMFDPDKDFDDAEEINYTAFSGYNEDNLDWMVS